MAMVSVAIIQYVLTYQEHTGWPQKSKPVPSDQQIVLNRIKACE